MANSISVSALTTYVDQLNIPIIKESVYSNKTFSIINRQTGVKYSSALNIMTSTLTAKATACSTFSPAGGVALSQHLITVCPLTVEEAICWDLLQTYWLGKVEEMEGSYTEDIPRFLYTAYIEDKINKISRMMEDIFWRGDVGSPGGAGNLGLCDGVLKYVSASSTTVKVLATTAGALTAATAIAAVNSVLDARPEAIQEADDQSLWCSVANFNTIYRAYMTLNNYFVDATAYAAGTFLIPGSNVTLRATAGLSGSFKMVLTTNSNLYFGTDSMTDAQAFDVWYERNDDEIHFRAKWKQGFAVAYDQYVVLYTGATS